MEHAGGALFHIGPLEVTGTVVTSWAIIIALTIISILATRRLRDIPGPLQTAAEMAINALHNFFAGTLGEKDAKKYLPIFATFFIFIVVSNYSGQLPGAGHYGAFKVPTASLSVTAALAVVAFCTTQGLGIKERGLKHYLKGFLKPVALLLPLTLLEQIVRPFSLALRLYGNIYGEEMVLENLYEIFPLVLPLIMNVLSLLFCMLQAMVFTMLLAIYVSEAIEEEE